MTNLFFLRGLVSTARKCLLAVLRKQFTPVVERTVSNTQIARDLMVNSLKGCQILH